MSNHFRCDTPISFEDVSDGYYAQCPECDEDLFTFEVVQWPSTFITIAMEHVRFVARWLIKALAQTY